MFRGVSLLAQSSFSRLARSHRDEFSRCSQLPSRYLHREREDRPPRKCFKLRWIVRRCGICKVILRRAPSREYLRWRVSTKMCFIEDRAQSRVHGHFFFFFCKNDINRIARALNKGWFFRVRWLYTLKIMRTFFILFSVSADHLQLHRITVLDDYWLIFISRYRRSSFGIFGKN